MSARSYALIQRTPPTLLLLLQYTKLKRKCIGPATRSTVGTWTRRNVDANETRRSQLLQWSHSHRAAAAAALPFRLLFSRRARVIFFLVNLQPPLQQAYSVPFWGL